MLNLSCVKYLEHGLVAKTLKTNCGKKYQVQKYDLTNLPIKFYTIGLLCKMNKLY